MFARNPIPLLRAVGLVEGVSFLLLLGVAMPLKYFAGLPQAVKVVGWAHGLMFMAFCVALLATTVAARWPLSRAALLLAAALLPFGPFVVDRRLRRWDEQFRHGGTPA
jgi:integral membrane protein